MNKELPIKPHDYALAVHEQIYTEFAELMDYPRFFDGFNLPTDSAEYWVSSLGPDVNGLTHPLVVYDRMVKVIKAEDEASLKSTGEPKFSELERQDMVSTTLIHDTGELKKGNLGVGDIPDPAKNDHTNKLETAITKFSIFRALNILQKTDYQIQFDEKILEAGNPDQHEQLLNAAADFLKKNLSVHVAQQGEILFDLYKRIAQDKNSYLGKYFYLAEKTQYLDTAMKAFSGYHPYPHRAPYLNHPYFIANRTLFAGETIQFHLPFLVTSTRDFAYSSHFLSQNQKNINGMISLVRTDLDPSQKDFVYQGNYRPSFFSWEKFNPAAKAWQQWKSKTTF